MDALNPLRQRIDEIDDEILRLLTERAEIVLEVGRIKNTHQAPLHVPEREAAILKRLMDNNPGPFPQAAVKSVFKEIISHCLNMEGPIRIAYLGPEATYTHLAARHFFGSGCTFVPCESIPEVVAACHKGQATYGIVPVENSTEGSVVQTLDEVAASELHVCGEVIERIHHCLLSREESLEKVTRVHAHPQAFAQCREWLRAHLPSARLEPAASNALAASRVANEPGGAAIAARVAADVYELNVLAEHIEDNPSNRTRFWVFGGAPRKAGGNDKTSVLLSVKDEAGSLYEALSAFQRHGISLSKIESRPSKMRPWEYLFFIDVAGHPGDAHIQAALAEVEHHCLWAKVLGGYPVADEPEI